VQQLRNVIVRITLGFAAFGPSWGCNNFSSLKQNHYSSYSVLVLEIFFLFVLVLVNDSQSFSFSFSFSFMEISLVGNQHKTWRQPQQVRCTRSEVVLEVDEGGVAQT
jgi:hypothetical protein